MYNLILLSHIDNLFFCTYRQLRQSTYGRIKEDKSSLRDESY